MVLNFVAFPSPVWAEPSVLFELCFPSQSGVYLNWTRTDTTEVVAISH